MKNGIQNDPKEYTCQACGYLVKENETSEEWIDPETKELLCPECYFERYFCCIRCSESFPSKDAVETKYGPICKSCESKK